MLAWMRRSKLKRRLRELAPSDEEFNAVVAGFPCLAGLDPESLERLRRKATRILAGKEFRGAAGLEPGYADCLRVSVLAALPILNLDDDWYADFQTFILYAEEFMADNEDVDEAGVVHAGRDLRSGEAWHRGPVVLALADVAQSGQGEGYNVVVHELAHQMDQANGAADGFPPLPPGLSPKDWSAAFTLSYRELGEILERGGEPFIDPYAAESPAEFFAVACEFFFDVPDWLSEARPEIYRLLARFFRQDPARRLSA